MQAGGPASESLQGRKPRVGEALLRETPAYGDLAIGRAAASGVGGVFSPRAKAAAPSGTGGSAWNGGSAARRDTRSGARIGFGATGESIGERCRWRAIVDKGADRVGGHDELTPAGSAVKL